MNIEQAKRVPIFELLNKLNIHPKKEDSKSYCYLSPIRNEKTPSFRVRKDKNDWYDFGLGCGGDIVDLAGRILQHQGEACEVPDALRLIENMTIGIKWMPVIVDHNEKIESSVLQLKNIGKLKKPALVNYLTERGIPYSVYNKYVREVYFHNKSTGQSIYALGIKNEEGGYEVRNPGFKGCIGKKTVTFIRGTVPKPEHVHIFEGFIDFLTLIVMNNSKPLEGDAIILNSVSMINSAYSYIAKYGYKIVYTWMDNDAAGNKAKSVLDQYFKMEENLVHSPMNKIYDSYKDLNEWHVVKSKQPEVK
jgi:hypothetical protein